MTREIKFRAWDKENKKMCDVIDFTCMNYPEEYEVMQYTGLLDKNGKEIYEGDILSDEGWNNVVIKWEDAQSFSLSEEYGQYAYDFTIIGNIYENPNLLQDSTKGVTV